MQTLTAPPPGSPSRPWTPVISPSSGSSFDLSALSTIAVTATSPWVGNDDIITIKADDNSDNVTFMFKIPNHIFIFFINLQNPNPISLHHSLTLRTMPKNRFVADENQANPAAMKPK
ncbi:hypothetical protein JHK82_016566 [Glycine max]|nr:hypothetical protein JHK82_016566 [Glycine max]